jgi:adenine-specific DNA-methyltransferase
VDRRETQRRAVQRAFDAERSLKDRNLVGQFATPPELARAVTREALKLHGGGPIRFGEPSVGSGAFFAALLAEGGLPAAAWGVERDETLAGHCRSIWAEAGLTVHTGDFTRMSGLRANLILANPPYVRHHHLTPAQKSRLRARVQEVVGVTPSLRSGLYVHFMFLGIAALEPGGLAAWLVPTEWLRVGYGAKLRGWVSQHHRIERVHAFDADDEQFGDALVSSSVLFVRRAAPGSLVPFTSGGTLAMPARTEEVAVARLQSAERWPPPPDVDGAVVGDCFRVKRGIATGANAFFLVTRARARHLGLSPAVLRPVLPSPRDLDSPVIDDPGDLLLLDCKDVPDPALRKYLDTGEARGLHERYLLARRRPWYRQEQRDPAPFVCAYMGRKSALRVFWNRARCAATNRWLLLYPNADLEEGRAWEILRGLDPADAVTYGRKYGGGLNKLEPSELLRLPLRQLSFSQG